ncbi:unnamed protein product [Strongylus vulgaris]|uniref:Uncharacterized protein n=1 Tax=Strongylus vulgaris TaxID=40348 RepID=A0A3P7J5M1_STRVU|nr:unnamed protein product [Strongylus vulgaris]
MRDVYIGNIQFHVQKHHELAKEDSLTFEMKTFVRNTMSLQFIELQVPEDCSANRKAMQEMILSDYGIVVLCSKSREKEDSLTFEMKTFVRSLRYLFSAFTLPITALVLTPEFSVLKNGESISRCSPIEHIFAIIKQSPGYDNHCDDNVDYLEKFSVGDDCEEDTYAGSGDVPSDSMDLDEMYEPHLDVIMDADDFEISSITRQATQPPAQKHCSNMDFIPRGAKRRENQDIAIDATVTATLSAYTIAKQGLPLTSQFPLMMLTLRTGTRVGTAHYEATTAKRMIKNFAEHPEYDLLKYVIDNDLPFSILMDGSPSSRGTKWMSFMIRTITPSFKPYTFHLLLSEMARETGETITNVLLSHLEKRSLWVEAPGLAMSPHDHAMKRLVAITADGANTMIGHTDGVFGRVRKYIREQTQASPFPRSDLLLSV